MHNTLSIPIIETPYAGKLTKAFLSGESIGGLNPGKSTEGSLAQKASKKKYTSAQRKILVRVLKKQYQQDTIELEEDSAVLNSINSLLSEDTFTFTTGQQIHIFLGPLFFIYKIQSLLARVKYFNSSNSGYKAVPVFWMATEDHDLEEINYVKLYNEIYQWDMEPGNAVGKLKCSGLEELLEKIWDRADKTEENDRLFSIFRKHYTANHTLAAATRSVLHELFGKDGLIILDPDHPELKSMFTSILEKEIEHRVLYNSVSETNEILKREGFEPRVGAMEGNFFLLKDNLRQKLRPDDDGNFKDESGIKYTKETFMTNPEWASPNVLLRPVYQECILPNLMYLGGSAEIEYWLPLQKAFKEFGLEFPDLTLRDSVMVINNKTFEAIERSGIEWHKLFENEKQIAEMFASKHQHGSNSVSGAFLTIESHLQELKTDFEKRPDTPGVIYKELNQIRKDLSRLKSLMEEEDLRSKKENQELNKLLKIKQKYFDSKQEREQFVVSKSSMTGHVFHKKEMGAELILIVG